MNATNRQYRLLTILTIVALALTLLPGSALAAQEWTLGSKPAENKAGLALRQLITPTKADTSTDMEYPVHTMSTYGQPATLQASVSAAGSTPTGQVTFYDGATPLGAAPLVSGLATLTISTMPLGAHPITASYAGDELHNPSTSQAVTYQVTPRLRLKKTADRDVIPAGWIIRYTIKVTNDTPATLSTITISDTLPGGTVFASAGEDGVATRGTVVWQLSDVPAGASREVHLSVWTHTTLRGVITNTATASAGGATVSATRLVRVRAP